MQLLVAPCRFGKRREAWSKSCFHLGSRRKRLPCLVSGGTWLSLWCLTCRMGLKTLPCWPSGHRGGWKGHSGSPWFGAGRGWDGCLPWKRPVSLRVPRVVVEDTGLSGRRCRPVLLLALAGQGSSVSYAQPRSPVCRARDRTQPGPAPEGCILLVLLPSEQTCLMRRQRGLCLPRLFTLHTPSGGWSRATSGTKAAGSSVGTRHSRAGDPWKVVSPQSAV